MADLTSPPEEIRRTLDFVVDPYNGACGCMGPQGDEPLCPCAMNSVIRWRGRWIKMEVVGGDTPSADFLSDLVPGSTTPRAYDPREYDVMLVGIDEAQKISVMRVIRAITHLGLTEIKRMVDALPKAIKEGISHDEAEYIKKLVEDVGGKVELR
jgi:large subunit ribosomal protein L7/L12